MSKCIDCGSNFVGTPEQPPPEGLRCKSCDIKRLKSENARLTDERDDSEAKVMYLQEKLSEYRTWNARLAALFLKGGRTWKDDLVAGGPCRAALNDLLAPTIEVIDKMPYCAKCSNILYTVVDRLLAACGEKDKK